MVPSSLFVGGVVKLGKRPKIPCNVCPGREVTGDFIACDYPRQMFPCSNRTFYHRLAVRILLIPSLLVLAGCAPALTGAAARGDINEVNRLLDEGADLNEKDGNGFTAIALAAMNGKSNMVKLLADRGADVNIKELGGGWTPLHLAVARTADIETVRALIEKGADLNVKDSHKWTPLHWATYYGRAGIVRLLVEAGSDLTARADRFFVFSGGTALEIAREKGLTDIALIITEAAKGKTMGPTKPQQPPGPSGSP